MTSCVDAPTGDSAQPAAMVRTGFLGQWQTRTLGLVLCTALVVLLMFASIAVGAQPIGLSTVMAAFTDHDPRLADHVIVIDRRLPRTLIGVLVAMALGVGGAVMQGLTRNPLADPGILGINAGAALFVVIAIGFLGMTGAPAYIWFAFLGAALASVAVYLIGSSGRHAATPVRLALAGAALTTFLGSITGAVVLTDAGLQQQVRYWGVGTLSGRELTLVAQIAPFVVVGLVIAFGCAPALNALALGDDMARGLGQRVAAARAWSAVAVVVLCGAATAAVGPIGFVGLVVPHVARLVTGPDYRWIMGYSMVMAPVLLLGADILGRVVVRPSELQAGIVTIVVGAPFFIWLVRRRKVIEL